MSCINWNPIHDVGCGVKGVTGGVATSVFDDVAQDFAHLAEHATAWVWSQLDTATAVRLAGASWDGVLQVTVELGVLVCVTMFLLQVTFSALRHEPGGLGRAVRGVMIAMVGMFACFIITDSLLALVDSLSDGVMQALAGTTSWNALGAKVIHSNTLTSGAIGSAGMLVGALIMLLSSIVVWLALMVRKMLVIISAAFAPIAFGGAPFDVTSAWVRRWIEFTIAMVFSKLILVILFGIGLQIELGLGQVGTATTQEITQMATGLLVMSVAGFAPWLALQFVHWAGGSLQQAGQHARSAGTGAQQAIAVPQRMYAGGRVVGAAAASGAAGLAVAAARLAGGAGRSGGNGNSNSSGSNGSSGGPDPGDKVRGTAASRTGAGGAAAETAYEAGKTQTGQALAAGGGSTSGGQGTEQSAGSQGGGGRGNRGGQAAGNQGKASSGSGSGGDGAGGASPGSGGAGGSGAGAGASKAPSRGDAGSSEPSSPAGGPGGSASGSSPARGSAPSPSQGGQPTGPGDAGRSAGKGGQAKPSGRGLGGEPTGPGGGEIPGA